ncbi:MAG: anaerobic ribonucleoside-triphosphate reductase activating protein [Clostridia bacterium]
MQVLVNGIIKESIVDGPGMRYVIFTQGCPHFCKGCHNPETHAFDKGYYLKFSDILDYIKKDPLNDGVTLSGGEPMMQAEILVPLAREIKNLGKSIMIYSGFTYEEIITKPHMKELLSYCDILVDGKFIEEQKSLLLTFRGSTNQRVIDVQKTIKTNEIIIKEF